MHAGNTPVITPAIKCQLRDSDYSSISGYTYDLPGRAINTGTMASCAQHCASTPGCNAAAYLSSRGSVYSNCYPKTLPATPGPPASVPGTLLIVLATAVAPCFYA